MATFITEAIIKLENHACHRAAEAAPAQRKPNEEKTTNLKICRRQDDHEIVMRRRVSGCSAPNTASSASVCVSSFVLRPSSSRQPSWCNSNAAPASLTTISITGPSPPTPVSFSRQTLPVNVSATMQPAAYASSGSVSSARRGVCQRTSLRNVGSCRSTRCTVPALLSGRSLTRSAWAPSGSRASIAEDARQAFSATRNANYGGHSRQSLDNGAMRLGSSFQCTQAASFSHVLCSPQFSGRRPRELTTVLSSVDIEVTHTSRRASSRSSAFDYSAARQPAQLSTIALRPVAIEPPQLRSMFSPASESSTLGKPSDVPESDSSSFGPKSPVQSVPENGTANKDAAVVSPPRAIEFTPLQPTREDGKQTEPTDSHPAQLSPPTPITVQPMSQDLLTPLKPLDLLSSPPMRMDLTSPPKPIGSLLSQPMSTGLLSPPKPIDVSSAQPMSLQLLSPPRPIEFGQVQGLSLQVEAKPSEAAQSAGSLSLTPKSPEEGALFVGKPESPLVEVKALSPPRGADTQSGTLVEVNSAVPLQLQLVLSPPKATDIQPQQTSPQSHGLLDNVAGNAGSGPLSPMSNAQSPELKQGDLLKGLVASPPQQVLESTNAEPARRPSTFVLTPPTPVIRVPPQARRNTLTGMNLAERRLSTKKP